MKGFIYTEKFYYKHFKVGLIFAENIVILFIFKYIYSKYGKIKSSTQNQFLTKSLYSFWVVILKQTTLNLLFFYLIYLNMSVHHMILQV